MSHTTRPPSLLTDCEVQLLLKSCSRRAPTGLRNRALIAILYRAGLRISEALALLPGDVSLEDGTVRVQHGKGDKARTAAFDAGCGELLAAWMLKRSKLGLNGRHPLFCTLRGERVKDSYVRAMLPRLARKAGLEKRVHAHGLRHTHAAQLSAEGVPMHVIRQQLGHANLAVTDRYLSHIMPEGLAKAMRKREWSAEDERRASAVADSASVESILEALDVLSGQQRLLRAALRRKRQG